MNKSQHHRSDTMLSNTLEMWDYYSHQPALGITDLPVSSIVCLHVGFPTCIPRLVPSMWALPVPVIYTLISLWHSFGTAVTSPTCQYMGFAHMGLPILLSKTNHHHTNHFTALFPGPPGSAGTRRELLDFLNSKWCKGRLTEADTPTIQMGATPSGLTSAHLHHPAMFFYRPDALPAAQPSCVIEVSYLFTVMQLICLIFFVTLVIVWHCCILCLSLCCL